MIWGFSIIWCGFRGTAHASVLLGSSQEDPSSMAPADLFPPKSQQEGRELWLGVTLVGTPRLQQLYTPSGLCICAGNAQGWRPGTPSC